MIWVAIIGGFIFGLWVLANLVGTVIGAILGATGAAASKLHDKD